MSSLNRILQQLVCFALLINSFSSCKNNSSRANHALPKVGFLDLLEDATLAQAKKGFFDGLNESAFALVNSDDRNGMVMLQNTKAKKFNYGVKSMADFKCRLIENQFTGLMLNLNGQDVHCRLVGSFNAYNLKIGRAHV